MRRLLEAISRLRQPEIPASTSLAVSQDEARAVLESFLSLGDLQSNSDLIRGGSFAFVYRFPFQGCYYAIKEAKFPLEESDYCLDQLKGQALLTNQGYPHFAPYNPEPIDDRFLVQRFLPGVPSYNIIVQAEIGNDLADYNLYLADAKANAILSPAFKKPILIDLSGVSFL